MHEYWGRVEVSRVANSPLRLITGFHSLPGNSFCHVSKSSSSVIVAGRVEPDRVPDSRGVDAVVVVDEW